MLAHPTNPDLALNLPHLKERHSTRSSDNGSGTKYSYYFIEGVITQRTMDAKPGKK